ncbi:hypothetical protein Tco_0909800 [Tanacetum coccineum]|uniref:Uncharacterized protein n=1 Tax=Tanacetum coccineum TaxID=301880 RepID=A0ABQ5CR77_9ASTR
MKNNQISLFTKSSTSVVDLSDMDLKLKLLNRIHENKTHPTKHKIYDNIYESILLDQDALDAQEAEPSFHKRSHDNQDSPNNRKGEKKKKRQKDVGQPSTQTSRKDKAPMKSGLANAMRRTTWFDLLLKSNIDQNEDHIFGPSIVAIAKKLKEIIQKEELTIAYLEGAGLEKLKLHYKNDVKLEYHVDQLKAAVVSEAQWNSDEGDVSKPRSFECHMSKGSKPHPSFYNNNFYYLVDLSTKEKYTTSLTKHYAARYHIQDLPRLSLNDIEDMYLLKVQDNMHHLPSEDEKDFNNALLLFIRRTNKMGRSNERLKGRDWNDKDIMKSKEMVNKIDQVMKRREQLRRLEAYVGGCPKTINPRVFVRPM